MSTLAAAIDSQLRLLDSQEAERYERLLRDLIDLMRSSVAKQPEGAALRRRAPFPLVEGTPGNVINPTKEQLTFDTDFRRFEADGLKLLVLAIP